MPYQLPQDYVIHSLYYSLCTNTAADAVEEVGYSSQKQNKTCYSLQGATSFCCSRLTWLLSNKLKSNNNFIERKIKTSQSQALLTDAGVNISKHTFPSISRWEWRGICSCWRSRGVCACGDKNLIWEGAIGESLFLPWSGKTRKSHFVLGRNTGMAKALRSWRTLLLYWTWLREYNTLITESGI